jgi:4-hydroxy-2-oxoheptanedioate aldolase
MSSNPFKSWLRQPPSPPPLGTWLMSAAPAVAEALGFCGFDFLVVDMEHSPIDLPDTVSLLRAIAGTPAQPLVRVAWNDQVLVKRVMDAGARNVMFPFIQTADEARAAVSYTRYPPDGVRGVAAIHRASRFGSTKDYLQTANDEVAVVIQLETPAAIGRLKEIAAVPGVDSVFVGPGDLSAAMGHLGNVGHNDVQALIAEAVRGAHAAGKPIGIVGGTPDMLDRFLTYGYDWVALGSDLALMTTRATDWLTMIRGQRSGDESPGSSAAY